MAVIFDQDLFIPVDVVLEGAFAPKMPAFAPAAVASATVASVGAQPVAALSGAQVDAQVAQLDGLLTQVRERRRPARAA